MSISLPYSTKDVPYDNAKIRSRSLIKAANQMLSVRKMNRSSFIVRCSTGKFLVLLMIAGLAYLSTTRSRENPVLRGRKFRNIGEKSDNPEVEEPDWTTRQEKVREAFIHAWSSYRNHAMGYDELKPLSGSGTDGLGGLGATVVDALDTAMIMDVGDVVEEAGRWIEANLPDRIREKGQVNLFETTIRVLGGLLSAHHLSSNATSLRGPQPEVYLRIATQLADSLMPAFTSSPSPIPFSDVFLRDHSAHPCPDGLSTTSEVSTLQLEFNHLSFLTGDPKYSAAAMKVLEHIRHLPKTRGLVPIRINPMSGDFSGDNIRLGSRGDSYYEYLIKVWLQLHRRRDSDVTAYLHDLYREAVAGVKHLLVRKSVPTGLVFVGELPSGPGGPFLPKMDHLVCFLPAALALGATAARGDAPPTLDDLDDLRLAEDLARTCFEMYNSTPTGLAPEIVYFRTDADVDGPPGDILVKAPDRHSLLRPEAVESFFVLHRATGDPKYRRWGWKVFEAFERHARLEGGGYTSLDDVTVVPPPRRDKMETFFLGETLKYLYLLFGDATVIPLDRYVFNTEAHPIPVQI